MSALHVDFVTAALAAEGALFAAIGLCDAQQNRHPSFTERTNGMRVALNRCFCRFGHGRRSISSGLIGGTKDVPIIEI
jgi:hypothetical protein